MDSNIRHGCIFAGLHGKLCERFDHQKLLNLMRHRILTYGLLSLALLMSGWGGVLAAAFCAHDAGQPNAMAEDHECCRAKLEGVEQEHCALESSKHSSHEAMTTDEMEAMSPVAEQATPDSGFAFKQNDTTCLHCVSRNGLPTTVIVTREAEQKKRDAHGFAHAAPKLIVPPAAAAFFAQTPLNRQGAPPGIAARRHLLLNIFVI
jgi:hypothetical protein